MAGLLERVDPVDALLAVGDRWVWQAAQLVLVGGAADVGSLDVTDATNSAAGHQLAAWTRGSTRTS